MFCGVSALIMKLQVQLFFMRLCPEFQHKGHEHTVAQRSLVSNWTAGIIRGDGLLFLFLSKSRCCFYIDGHAKIFIQLRKINEPYPFIFVIRNGNLNRINSLG